MLCVGGVPQCPVSTPAVMPASKLPKIEPRQTTVALVPTDTSTRPPYLLVATSVGNSPICQPRLKSPSNPDVIQTAGTAQVLKSLPSYVIVPSSVGNSVSNSVGNSRQCRLQSAGAVGGAAWVSSSNSVVMVSCSSTTSSVVPCFAPESQFRSLSGSTGSNLVLHTAGGPSTPGVLATFVLPAAPLVRVIASGSTPPVQYQYVLPSPTVHPVSLQSPSNSVPVGDSRLSFVQTSSSNYIPIGHSQGNQLSSLGNTKLTMAKLSSSNCLLVGNSQLPVVQPPVGNSPSTVVRQSSSDCVQVGNSCLSGVAGIPASTAIQPLLGKTQSNIVQQSSSYYVPVGNSQSSSIMGIPVSLMSSTLPHVVLLGQTVTADLTASLHPQPQHLHSASLVSASQ